MLVQGASNLQRGQDQSSWRVQHEVQRHGGVRQVNGPQDLFRIIDIDIAKKRGIPECSWFPGGAQEYHSGFPHALDPGDQALAGRLRKCCLRTGWSAESMKNTTEHRQEFIAILSDRCPTAISRRFPAGWRQNDSTPQHYLPQWPLHCDSKVECGRKRSISLWRFSMRSAISKITLTPAKFTPRSCLKRKMRPKRSTEETENSGQGPVFTFGSTNR